MPTIWDQFDELYSPTTVDDVGDDLVTSTEERAAGLIAEAPTSAIPGGSLYESDFPVRGGEGSTEWADYAKSFGAGTIGVGEAVLGIPEYAARQSGLEGVADFFESGRTALGGVREDIVRSMTPEAQERIAREWLTLDPEKTMWQGSPIEAISSIGLKFSQALPSTLATLAPGALFFRAGMSTKALAYLGASEGALTLGGLQNSIADEINAVPHDQLLAESPYYAQAFEQTGDEAAARDELIRKAQGASPLVAGAIVGAISATTGRYLEPVFPTKGKGGTGGLPLGRRFGVGFGEESIQEGPQSAVEQFIQNYSAQVYDSDRQLSEGVAEATVEGTAIGGLTGGGFTATLGPRPLPPLPPAQEEPGGQLNIPGLGRQNLEPGEEAVEEGLDPAEVGRRNEQLPLVGGLDLDVRSGRDLSESTDFVRNLNTLSAAIEGEAEQQTLPVTLRERGRPVLQESPRGARVPTELPTDVTEPEPEDTGAAAEVARRTPDLLAGTRAPERQAVPAVPSKVEGHVVRLKDDEGNVIEEEVYESVEEASDRADELADDFPDAEITVTPMRSRAKVTTAPKFREEGRLEQVQAKEEKTISDEVRRRLPFDEREQFADEIVGAKSAKEAAARILARGAEIFEAEEGERQEGFYPPKRLEFANKDREAEYRKAWNDYLDAELTIETSNNKRAVTRAEKLREDALTELGRVRQTARPTLKPTAAAAHARAARKLGGEDVDRFERDLVAKAVPEDEETDYLGEFEAKSREDIDNLAVYVVRNKTRKATTWEEEEYRVGSIAREREKALKKRYPHRQVQVVVRETRELAEEFERAVRYREGRDEPTATLKREQQARPDYRKTEGTTPGKKLKFIRREAEYKRREEAGQRSVKATDVVIEAVTPRGTTQPRAKRGKGKYKPGVVSSAVLTTSPQKDDESVADRIERQNRFKKATDKLKATIEDVRQTLVRLRTTSEEYARLEEDRERRYQREVAKAKEEGREPPPPRKKIPPKHTGFSRFIYTERDPITGALSSFALDYLYGKQYVAQLVQFSEALIASKADNTDAIILMEKLTAALEQVNIRDEKAFVEKWGKLARANEFEQLTEWAEKSDVLKVMRDPARRKKATEKTNAQILNHAQRQRMLAAAAAENTFYRRFIQPVLAKMSMSIYDVVNGIRDQVYIPTHTEIVGVASYTERIMHENPELYKDLKRELKFVGFTFDEEGIMNHEFTPSDEYLGPYYRSKFQEPLSAAMQTRKVQTPGGEIIDPDPWGERERLVQAQEEQDIMDVRGEATVTQVVNYAINKLKERVASAKTTVDRIRLSEQRFINTLRKAGAWTDLGPELGRIVIKGGASKTYRLVGPRLAARTLTKPQARRVIENLTTFRVTSHVAATIRAQVADPRRSAAERIISEEDSDFFRLGLDEPLSNEDIVELEPASSAVGDMLAEPRSVLDVNDVLDTLITHLPNGFYKEVARMLRGLNMSDVKLSYDELGTEFKPGAKVYGIYKSARGRIYLNKAKLQDDLGLKGTAVLGAEAVHTIVHETLHAATAYAVKHVPGVRRSLEILRNAARAQWQKEFPDRPLPYGLRKLKADDKVIPVDEFLVEMFANEGLNDFLRTVQIPVQNGRPVSAWRRFFNAVIEFLTGRTPSTQMESAVDYVMRQSDVLFRHAGRLVEAGDLYNMEAYDSVLGPVANNVLTKVRQTGTIMKRVFESARKGIRYVMTMEQLRDAYADYFTDNSLRRYMDAFFARNARNAELMQIPEKYSRTWTELTEKDPEGAIEVSRIMTEATLSSVAAASPLDHKDNVHVKTDAQKERHRDLHSRFLALSPQAQRLYKRIRNYYIATSLAEGILMMENGLRGILTSGDTSVMTVEEFNKNFPRNRLRELYLKGTREDITAALEPYVKVDEKKGVDELTPIVQTLYRMANVARKEKGDYFPLMRYGDHVVFVEKKGEKQVFDDRKEAAALRSSLLSDDPTLDVDFYPEGDKWVVRKIDREFVMAESKSEAEAARERLLAEYKTGVSDVAERFDRDKMTAAIETNAGLNSVLKSLRGNPAAQAAIKNFYLRSLADASFRKREVTRKNRRGVDYDVQHRNFATYSKQSAYYIAQLQFGWQMGNAIQDMQRFIKERRVSEVEPQYQDRSTDELSSVVNQVVYRDKMTIDPTEVTKAVRSGVEITQFMMLTSPSYWAINATQPWLVTAPVMGGRFGMGRAYSALTNAQQLIKTPLTSRAFASWGGLKALKSRIAAEKAFDVVDQLKEHLKTRDGGKEYIDLIDTLRKRHIIDINVLTELREVAHGIESNTWSRVLDASRIMAHITEVNNRVVTAIAAYDLEFNRLMTEGSTREEAIEGAIEYAGNMVSQTQFNYSSANKPPLFQQGGPLGWAAPLLFQFMQWPQHMYALLIRNYNGAVKQGLLTKSEARSAMLGLLTTHAAVGGMVGMTLQPIKWAFGLAMLAFGDDDEPYTLKGAISGETFDRLIAETTNDLFGTTVSTTISKGLPAGLLGIDVSSRMSMGTLYFVDLRGENIESMFGSLLASFGGATLNQAMNWGRAAQKLGQGDFLRAAEMASPKIARDVFRAFRYYNEGLVNNAGDTVIPAEDLGFKDVVAQSFGFQPTDVGQFYEGQAAIKGAETFIKERKSELLRDYRTAEQASEIREAMRAVAEFNRHYPHERITRSALIQSIRSKREREIAYERFGANVDDRKAAYYKKYGAPYRK